MAAIKAKSLTDYKHIRFIGAGGIGMSALIKVLEEQKSLGQLASSLKISKYDKAWETNDKLTDDIDLAVVSTAIPEDDEDLSALKSRGVEIWHRRDMLLALTESQGQKSIVVSGTHGKTSCSGMLAHVLMHAGKDPSFVVGGILQDYKTNGHAGKGEYFVLEGDESDKSFMQTNPEIALIVNVEPDHLENYPGGLEEINDCFVKFSSETKKLVICLDSPNAKAILKTVNGIEILTYSIQDKSADLYLDGRNLIFKGEDKGLIDLNSFGDYNYQNALGIIASAHFAGLDFKEILEALKFYHGIKRRQEFIGFLNLETKSLEVSSFYNDKKLSKKAVAIYDDYAHHPTEVKALLDGALAEVKSGRFKRLVFVYQPHHPRRTQDFWKDFVSVFKEIPEPSLAMIANIYLARTGPIEGVSSELMVKEIGKANVQHLHFADAKFDSHNDAEYQRIKSEIIKVVQPGDLLMLVGAGNITKVSEAFRK